MWHVISNTMGGRSVILTTHSMEEAEALAHRIGIMVGGRLRCLGTNQHLKERFGKGYSLEVRAPEMRMDGVKSWLKTEFPTAIIKEDLGPQIRYEIPQERLELSKAWANLEEHRVEHGVTEYALSQTTLEQVFVRFAAEQEEETGMDADALSASIQDVPPHLCNLCLCKPQQAYEWTVSDGSTLSEEASGRLNVKVEFEHGCCYGLCCCLSNPGIVTVDGEYVEKIDEHAQVIEEQLLLRGSNNPGCSSSACCGCPSGSCGCSKALSCTKSQNLFAHSGKVFEVVDVSELPGTEVLRPCYLFVNGKEVETSIERNTFLTTLFQKVGKKYCCMVHYPTTLTAHCCWCTTLATSSLWLWFIVNSQCIHWMLIECLQLFSLGNKQRIWCRLRCHCLC